MQTERCGSRHHSVNIWLMVEAMKEGEEVGKWKIDDGKTGQQSVWREHQVQLGNFSVGIFWPIECVFSHWVRM